MRVPAVARAIAAATVLLALLVPTLAIGQQMPPESPVAAARDTEPVVLTGSQLPDWSARSNFTVRLPLMDLAECSEATNPNREFSREHCNHNKYAEPEVDTGPRQPEGPDATRILGYRWNGKRFVQIPFQVDEVFARYLHNSISGFAHYSGEDQHTTYEFDREGWRFAAQDPDNPCLARPLDDDGNPATPAPVTTEDPVDGLDDNDELAFMASDAGEDPAPADAPLPRGIESAKQVVVTDPANGKARYAYVMLAQDSEKAPKPEFTKENGYVDYRRDANADLYEKSESSYADYGNARRGVYCDAEGNVVRKADGTPDVQRRRPRDFAWIETPRYRFRYDGRWLMTQIRVSGDGGETYGPDLVDRWKARAYQQDPASETPCCGYEEEDTNWGGSSTLLGERAGPVRAVRETWGADSGTNVVRRETFYREEVRQKTWLRVHPITPVDGIYAQWDFNAGVMEKFYNPRQPEGVDVDGRNDEAFGNFDDPCNRNYDGNDTSKTDQGYRQAYRTSPLCHERMPYHQSIDNPDPTFSDPNAGLTWSQTSGPHGTIVDRYEVDRVTDATPGGTAHTVVAVPYYRDDSCFDDGTGTDPGPKINLRSGNEPRTWFNPATGQAEPRECWEPSDGIPDGSQRFFQGSIATHGMHLLLIADSDNARLTVPTTEIVAQHRLVMLPGNPGNVGERYGRGLEKPMAAFATPFAGGESEGPDEPDPGNGGGNGPGNGGGQGKGGGPPSGPAARYGAPPRSSSAPFTVRGLHRRRVSARKGAFAVRCLVPERRGRRCSVVAMAGRRVIGRGVASARAAYNVPVRVRLNRAGRALVRNSNGVLVRLLFSAVGVDGSRVAGAGAIRVFGR